MKMTRYQRNALNRAFAEAIETQLESEKNFYTRVTLDSVRYIADGVFVIVARIYTSEHINQQLARSHRRVFLSTGLWGTRLHFIAKKHKIKIDRLAQILL